MKVGIKQVSGFQGIALTATYDEIDQLLYIVENVAGYRDWDWLDDWLTRGAQALKPSEVISIYINDGYWRAVEQGDVTATERIRCEILGIV